MKDSILVVDDNQFERNLVVKALAARAQGCEMRQAGTAEEALASVAGDAPSIVLMDCKLPRMSGIDALRRLREEGHTFPVIVCTAANATELVLEALRAGATDYLVKDKNFFEMLPIAVDKAIGLHRLEAEKAKILERLRQSKDRYERLVVNAHDIMFQVDTKGRFLYVNPADERELGHRPDEFYDDPELACRLVHPEDRDRVRKTWGTLLQDGGEAVIETRVAAGGLQTQWYQVKIFGVPAQTGQILQGIARNVTESRELARQLQKEKAQLEEANRRLQEVNRLKNEFVASVSHELRTPMNSIIGYTDCLLDGLDGPLADEQASSLTRVRKNAGQLLNLLNDILDTAKIEAGKMQVNAEN
ncbi:MAG: response regulator, partial [Candidatus Wallbacteria bacterium]|nr:response regulator [Candidatus Wallbacteria bacterium]